MPKSNIAIFFKRIPPGLWPLLLAHIHHLWIVIDYSLIWRRQLALRHYNTQKRRIIRLCSRRLRGHRIRSNTLPPLCREIPVTRNPHLKGPVTRHLAQPPLHPREFLRVKPEITGRSRLPFCSWKCRVHVTFSNVSSLRQYVSNFSQCVAKCCQRFFRHDQVAVPGQEAVFAHPSVMREKLCGLNICHLN